jgi:hypothetical protein
MDLTFYPLTQEAIDQAAESLCLFIAADERPLTGLAGLADWRLSGRLSRLLRSGLLTGDAGEAVLTPPGSRLAYQKLFLFGVGKSSGQSEEHLLERVIDALRRLGQAGVQDMAMQLPARLPIEVGIRTLVDELQGPGRAVVFAPDPQKLMAALSQAASRGSARIERRVVKVPTPVERRAPPVKQVSQAVKTPRPPAPPVTIPTPPSIPKATPLPAAPAAAAPSEAGAPAAGAAGGASPATVAPAAPSAPSPAATPAARPLPDAPSAVPMAATPAAQTLPDAPAAPAPAATPLEPSAPAAAPKTLPAGEGKRPAPPPPQRYVPPPPKPHVFDKNRKK